MEMPARDSMVWDHNKPGYKEGQEAQRAEYAKKNAKKRAAVEESNRKFRVRMAAERKARGEAPWPGDQVSEESHERYLERKATEEKAKKDLLTDANGMDNLCTADTRRQKCIMERRFFLS
mgnify:CR=1 FL=1